MSTKTDELSDANPAGVTHTISRAFLLDGQTKEKLEGGDQQAFDKMVANKHTLEC